MLAFINIIHPSFSSLSRRRKFYFLEAEYETINGNRMFVCVWNSISSHSHTDLLNEMIQTNLASSYLYCGWFVDQLHLCNHSKTRKSLIYRLRSLSQSISSTYSTLIISIGQLVCGSACVSQSPKMESEMQVHSFFIRC